MNVCIVAELMLFDMTLKMTDCIQQDEIQLFEHGIADVME